MGVLFIWTGYHFSPWQSLLTGVMWDYYLLVPAQINNGLLFTTLAMFAFLFGYSRVFSRNYMRLRMHTPVQLAMPKVKPIWVFGMVVVVLAVTIITSGGLDELWSSQFSRGHGQFDERDYAGSALRMLSVIRLPLEVTLGLMASLLILRTKDFGPVFLLGFAALIVASLSSMWNFSRAAGFPFLFLAFLAFRMGVKRSLIISVAGVLAAFYLGSIGYHERGGNPGIANFIQAAISPKDVIGYASDTEEDNFFVNPLDAMAPFTRKAEQRELEPPPIIATSAAFFWNLNPLPSEIVPILPLGRGLSDVMETDGYVGLTTPAFAEAFYVFGLMGVVVVALIGAILGWFDRLTVVNPSVLTSITITLVFMSLAVGLHSSMRAMTRPMLYAAVLILITKLVVFKRRSTRNAGKY
ncbi:MAG: hypothetical protein IPG66_03005 [Hydrogenophilales bacterium]|nr:hypothetical protein [Hydrogenophilales bacterium]